MSIIYRVRVFTTACLLLFVITSCAASAAPVAQSTLVPAAPSATTIPPTVAPPTTSPSNPTPNTATPAPSVPTTAPAATAAPQEDSFLVRQKAALRPENAADLAAAAGWDRYTIIAAINPAERTIIGTAQVIVTNRTAAPFSTIWFHLYPNHPDFGGRLDVASATIDGTPVASRTMHGDTLFGLDLPQPLAPGAVATVDLGFVTRTPRNASNNTFGAFNQEAGVWSMANFYPILARSNLASGWDTRPVSSRGDFAVSSTALYEVTIDAPVGWTLVSTGVSTGVEPVTADVRRERFVSGPQREFYLAALDGLAQASSTIDGTRVVSYYQPGNPAAGERALAVAEDSLRIFNTRYGQYPLAEFEVIQAALTQFLGMEYPGVVLIEQELYRRNGRGLETTVVHEAAHQWWYSLAGNDAQSEPWLDEGMASYAQVLYYEALGSNAAATAELDAYRDLYRRAREAGRDAPLGSPPDALRGNYVPIVYAKGGLFFHALRNRIGEEAFSAFLREYQAAGRYRDVRGEDLLAAAENACDCDLQKFYGDWVLRAVPVPIP
ncbi:MAG: M1 family metallopeptidase [Oscillochloris sp.]|nr:M1 family metallopeptidase [Oscillochloris sp.]